MFDKIFCDYPWGIKAKDSIGSNEALQAIYDEDTRSTEGGSRRLDIYYKCHESP